MTRRHFLHGSLFSGFAGNDAEVTVLPAAVLALVQDAAAVKAKAAGTASLRPLATNL